MVIDQFLILLDFHSDLIYLYFAVAELIIGCLDFHYGGHLLSCDLDLHITTATINC